MHAFSCRYAMLTRYLLTNYKVCMNGDYARLAPLYGTSGVDGICLPSREWYSGCCHKRTMYYPCARCDKQRRLYYNQECTCQSVSDHDCCRLRSFGKTSAGDTLGRDSCTCGVGEYVSSHSRMLPFKMIVKSMYMAAYFKEIALVHILDYDAHAILPLMLFGVKPRRLARGYTLQICSPDRSFSKPRKTV